MPNGSLMTGFFWISVSELAAQALSMWRLSPLDLSSTDDHPERHRISMLLL